MCNCVGVGRTPELCNCGGVNRRKWLTHLLSWNEQNKHFNSIKGRGATKTLPFKWQNALFLRMTKWRSALLATRQNDDSSSVIQIPTTTPIIPNRREIRGWIIVGKQIVSFYEVQVNSRKENLTWNSFTCVSQHKCIEIYLFSHKLIYLSSAKKCLFNFLVCLIVFIYNWTNFHTMD